MIFVFKTSVKTKMQVKKLKLHIDKRLPKAKWNFDLEDCDRVLRVEELSPCRERIIQVLSAHGYKCEILV